MNNDLISREALKEEFAKHEDNKGYLIGDWEEIIDSAPTVERPQGKWIPQTFYDGFTYWKCSECGKKNDFAVTKFCFHCGAEMRVKNELNRVKDELQEGEG